MVENNLYFVFVFTVNYLGKLHRFEGDLLKYTTRIYEAFGQFRRKQRKNMNG